MSFSLTPPECVFETRWNLRWLISWLVLVHFILRPCTCNLPIFRDSAQIDLCGTDWVNPEFLDARQQVVQASGGIANVARSPAAPENPAYTLKCSLAHGAGRKWTRSESKSRIRDRYRPDELSQTELGSCVI